jgi:hypothetical protein
LKSLRNIAAKQSRQKRNMIELVLEFMQNRTRSQEGNFFLFSTFLQKISTKSKISNSTVLGVSPK